MSEILDPLKYANKLQFGEADMKGLDLGGLVPDSTIKKIDENDVENFTRKGTPLSADPNPPRFLSSDKAQMPDGTTKTLTDLTYNSGADKMYTLPERELTSEELQDIDELSGRNPYYPDELPEGINRQEKTEPVLRDMPLDDAALRELEASREKTRTLQDVVEDEQNITPDRDAARLRERLDEYAQNRLDDGAARTLHPDPEFDAQAQKVLDTKKKAKMLVTRENNSNADKRLANQKELANTNQSMRDTLNYASNPTEFERPAGRANLQNTGLKQDRGELSALLGRTKDAIGAMRSTNTQPDLAPEVQTELADLLIGGPGERLTANGEKAVINPVSDFGTAMASGSTGRNYPGSGPGTMHNQLSAQMRMKEDPSLSPPYWSIAGENPFNTPDSDAYKVSAGEPSSMQSQIREQARSRPSNPGTGVVKRDESGRFYLADKSQAIPYVTPRVSQPSEVDELSAEGYENLLNNPEFVEYFRNVTKSAETMTDEKKSEPVCKACERIQKALGSSVYADFSADLMPIIEKAIKQKDPLEAVFAKTADLEDKLNKAIEVISLQNDVIEKMAEQLKKEDAPAPAVEKAEEEIEQEEAPAEEATEEEKSEDAEEATEEEKSDDVEKCAPPVPATKFKSAKDDSKEQKKGVKPKIADTPGKGKEVKKTAFEAGVEKGKMEQMKKEAYESDVATPHPGATTEIERKSEFQKMLEPEYLEKASFRKLERTFRNKK